MWGVDDDLAIIAVIADPDEPARIASPPSALIGDAAPDPAAADRRPAARTEAHIAQGRDGEPPGEVGGTAWRCSRRSSPILEAIRAELPEDGIFVDEVTQVGFAARIALPVYKPRTFLSPGYQDNLGWGYATALGAQDARRDVPVLSINGDGGFMYTANELATAVRHRIPLIAIVFSDGDFGNVRRIQEENYGNRLIASDLANPDFVKFGESFGAAAERVRTPEELAQGAAARLRPARRADADRRRPVAAAECPPQRGPQLLGVRARSPAAPKLSANFTKSGLARSLAISRLPYLSSWMRRTLPNAPSLNTMVVSGMRWRTAVASSFAVNMKPPSPEIDTTGTSRRASWAPSAVAKPQPRLSW